MRPLHDNVWLLFGQGDRDVGGIRVRSTSPDDWMDATVVAVGPEVPVSLGVGVGDTVLANVYDGPPVFVGGLQMRSIPADRLLAVIGQ